jgi:hypothetical protein
MLYHVQMSIRLGKLNWRYELVNVVQNSLQQSLAEKWWEHDLCLIIGKLFISRPCSDLDYLFSKQNLKVHSLKAVSNKNAMQNI